VLDRRLVERLAEDLGTSPGLVEKDWHVVRALGVIAKVHSAGMMTAFSGGTSLSKGWELIKRFSEDIDFKVGEPVLFGRRSLWRAIWQRAGAAAAYPHRDVVSCAGAGTGRAADPLADRRGATRDARDRVIPMR
jgi:predicted nucleotidyltransferase component of viral defense system